MKDLRCWGIYRELAHSPGRETDDARILKRTGEALGARGYDVSFRTPEEALASAEPPPPFLFVMCERRDILARLAAWEEGGASIVNPPAGILGTYRDVTIARFAEDGVSFPRTALVPTEGPLAAALGAAPWWVKRADVHCTEPGDVVFVADRDAAEKALHALAARGISRAALQEHVPGDLIKFYGVGGPEDEDRWFVWFHHKDQVLAGHRFDVDDLEAAARAGAASLGLEVWGGDAIATSDGRIVLIDLNAWPSFALYRDEAAGRIAAHLDARFRRDLRQGAGARAAGGAAGR